MAWTFEHTETTTATPAQVWACYRDTANWPAWDQDTAEVHLDGPFETGATATLRPAKGPKTTITFADVEPDVGFTNVSRLPLARMSFGHRIEPTPTGCRFTHTVAISGPLSPLFGKVIGKGVAAGLPTAMRTLAQRATTVRTTT